MSKMVPVRMDEELVARIDAKTENRSALIVAAIEAYLGGRREAEQPEKMIIARDPKPERARPILKAAEPEKPRVEAQRFSPCPGCGAMGGLHQRWCKK